MIFNNVIKKNKPVVTCYGLLIVNQVARIATGELDEIVQQVADKMTESNGGKGLGLAQQLYELVEKGTPVICYHLPGTEVGEAAS